LKESLSGKLLVMVGQRSLAVLAVGVVCGLATPSLSQADDAEPSASDAGATQRWVVLDSAFYVGRIESSCAAGRGRVRYVNTGPTERVAVRLGSVLYAKAWIQPYEGLELPLGGEPETGGRVQHWLIKPISESLPPSVVFRVRPGSTRCARPVVSHRVLGSG
jgi:hypothetical protein